MPRAPPREWRPRMFASSTGAGGWVPATDSYTRLHYITSVKTADSIMEVFLYGEE